MSLAHRYHPSNTRVGLWAASLRPIFLLRPGGGALLARGMLGGKGEGLCGGSTWFG